METLRFTVTAGRRTADRLLSNPVYFSVIPLLAIAGPLTPLEAQHTSQRGVNTSLYFYLTYVLIVDMYFIL